MEFIIGCLIIFIIYKLLTRNKKHHHPNSIQNQSYSAGQTRNNVPTSKFSSTSNLNKDEDDLVTFTIYSGTTHNVKKSTNKTKGRWLAPNESITIQGRMLNNGFIYYGGVLRSLNGYDTEASLIDESLSASDPVNLQYATQIYADQSLGYWPSYASLSKECRGVFLDWLGSNRANPNMPIGYIFIYFYGLERRIVSSKDHPLDIKDSEYLLIFDEIIRLNSIYAENYSFRNYSNNLLSLMIFLRPHLFEEKTETYPHISSELSFKLLLSKTVMDEGLITAELAFEWLKYSFEYSLKTPARRCEYEYKLLFNLRFKQQFGDGFKVKPNKTKLRLSYHSASSSIGYVELFTGDLPEPSILKAPINKIIPIAERCTQELSAYSRYLGREGVSRNDIAALMLLPEELLNDFSSPIIDQLKQWASEVVTEQQGLTTVKELWAHINTELPTAINKKENELIQNLMGKIGIGIAPDTRIHQVKIKPDEYIVLFNSENGSIFQPSNEFYYTEMLLRLGAIVANIDGHIHSNERHLLEQFISTNEKLSATEKQYLFAYLIWRINSVSSMEGIKSNIAKLDENQRKIISKLLISIALADGMVDVNEIKQIEKLYTTLGLDKSLVSSDIHTLSTSKASSSNSIPTTNNNSIEVAKDKFMLDSSILKLHETETNDVQSLLGTIFADNEEIYEPTSIVPDNKTGLDRTHHQLYETLITQEKWSRNDVLTLCKKFGLMLDGAIETINEWSYECVDAPLIEDNDDIYIDFEILEELKG